MYQLVFKNRLYIRGKLPEVIMHLKELSLRYKTVKQLLDDKAKPM